MRYLLFIALIICLYSCHTSRETIKTVIQIDSTAYHKFDSLHSAYRLDSIAYENTISLLNQNAITFDCPPCDSSDKTVITFDSAGVIRRIEGRVKSIKTQSDFNQKEAIHWKQLYDSLTHVERKDSVTVKTNIIYKDKIVKKQFIPWWIWVLLIIAGLLWLNERFNIVKIPFITKK